MNEPLNEKMTTQILAKIEEGYEIEQSGDLKRAEAVYGEAWNMLPEPQHQWDLSLTVARTIVEFHYEKGSFKEAKQWLSVAFQCFVPPIDTSTDILAGKVYLDSGDAERAREHLGRAYEKGKRRAFSEEDPKYLKFVLEKD